MIKTEDNSNDLSELESEFVDDATNAVSAVCEQILDKFLQINNSGNEANDCKNNMVSNSNNSSSNILDAAWDEIFPDLSGF